MTRKIFRLGIFALGCLSINVMTFAQYRLTTSQLNTINTNQTAEDGILYFDTELEYYRIGQSDGTLTAAPDQSSYKQTTSALTTLVSAQSALENILYWNTELKKYFKGLSGGTLSRASQFIQNLFSGDWFQDGHALDDSGDRSTKPGNNEIKKEGKYLFDGIDDQATVTNPDFENVLTSGSWSCIFIPKASAGGEQILTWTKDIDNSWGLAIQSGRDIGVSARIGGVNTSASSNFLVTPDEKYVVTATWDGSNIKLYVNGVLQTGTDDNSLSGNNPNVLALSGRTNNATSNTFTGEILDAKVYDRVLSAKEIEDYYNSKETSSEGLLAYYKMDEGSGTTMIDSSGNGNNGTIANATESTFHTSEIIGYPGNGDIQPGRVYDFSSGDYVDLGTGNILDGETKATIYTKFKTTSSNQVLYGFYDTGGGVGAYINNGVVNYWANGWKAGQKTVTDGQWHELIVIHDTLTPQITAFVDGELDYQGSFYNSFSHTGENRIGQAPTGGYGFTGEISDFRIYDTTLVKDSITSLLNNPYSQIPTQENQITATNGGGIGTTDWVDSNSDGTADGWGSQYAETATMSIVTGNGFSGNAQRYEAIDGSNKSLVSSTYFFESGKTYRVSMKYRMNLTGTISRIFMDNGASQAISVINGNQSTATYIEKEFTAAIDGPFLIYAQSSNMLAGDWFEIDEVNIIEITDPAPLTQYKMDEGNGTIAYDSSGNGNHGTITNADLSTFHATDTEGSDWANQFGYSEGLENITAGTAYLESEVAYGTWEFDVIRTGNAYVSLLSSDETFSGNGYQILFESQRIIFRRYPTANLFVTTSSAKLDPGIPYRIKITRTTDGEFSVYAKGGTFGDTYTLIDPTGGVGSNPVTDNTFTTSKYIVTDFDAGDQIANLSIDENPVSVHDFTDGTGAYAKPILPRDESDTTKDVLGDDLAYAGRANYHAKLVGSHAGNFDGTSDYISVPDDESFRFDGATQDFSLSAWVKTTSTDHVRILSKQDADDDGWRLILYGGNTVWASVNTIDVKSASSNLNDGNWHHIAAVINRDGNGQIYVDGNLDGTPVPINSTPMSTTNDLHIGKRSYLNDRYFDGPLADIRIFNRTLSNSEVKTLFQGGNITAGLFAHYPLAEGSGTTIYDASGNGNHGTLTTSNETSFWSATQDNYHHNLTKGFTLSGSVKIPANSNKNGKDAQGNFLSNPPGPYHNNAETKIQQYAAPQLVTADLVDGGNFWFDTNLDPVEMTYTNFTTNAGSRSLIRSTSSTGDASYQKGRWRIFAQ